MYIYTNALTYTHIHTDMVSYTDCPRLTVAQLYHDAKAIHITNYMSYSTLPYKNRVCVR